MRRILRRFVDVRIGDDIQKDIEIRYKGKPVACTNVSMEIVVDACYKDKSIDQSRLLLKDLDELERKEK